MVTTLSRLMMVTLCNYLYNKIIEYHLLDVQSKEQIPRLPCLGCLVYLTIAEYSRNQDMLLFIDNLFRFKDVGSEVSICLFGFGPSLSFINQFWRERISTTKNDAITSVQAIYVLVDDLTDSIYFSAIAELGIPSCG